MPTPLRCIFACLLAVAALACPARAQDRVLTGFNNPLTFTYGSWQHVARVETGRLIIDAANGQGGAGYAIARDLAALGDRVPVLTLTLSPDNRARAIRLMLRDSEDRSSTWQYDLQGQAVGRAIRLRPVDNAPLSRPSDPARPLALRNITQLHILGDDGQENIALELDQVSLPPSPREPATQPGQDQQ
jgi:hypothetical protein